MVKRSRREFLKDAGFGCLSLSVTPYLIGVSSEVASETIGNFNKHSFLNPNLIGWNDIGPLQDPNEFGVMIPSGMQCKLIAQSGKKYLIHILGMALLTGHRFFQLIIVVGCM